MLVTTRRAIMKMAIVPDDVKSGQILHIKSWEVRFGC